MPTLPTTLPGAGTAPSLKRGRGRPPKTRKRLVRAKARTRKKETTTTMPSETAIPTEASEVPRYQLRSRRQPRYKCGTCGLRDCVCLLAVNENRRVPTGARGVPPERGENLVHGLTVRAEKQRLIPPWNDTETIPWILFSEVIITWSSESSVSSIQGVD